MDSIGLGDSFQAFLDALMSFVNGILSNVFTQLAGFFNSFGFGTA